MISIGKKIFDLDFSSPSFDVPKTWNSTSGEVQNRETETGDWGWLWRRFRTCMKFRGKQISQTFPHKRRTFVPFLSEFLSSQYFLITRFFPSVSFFFLLLARFQPLSRVRCTCSGTYIGVRAPLDLGERGPYCPKKNTQCPKACVGQTHSNRSKNNNAPNS